MACYKSALIDLDRRWANKGQDMKEKLKEHLFDDRDILWYLTGNQIDLVFKSIDVFFESYQPDRLRRVDTSNSEAIVGSANIDEIAELNRND